ncbi:MAG: acetolactate synthase, partial [Alphaproteobacteria bacterium]
SEAAFAALAEFCERWAIPLSHYWSNQLAIPLAHPMQIGAQPEALLAEADIVLIINALAPWQPERVTLRDDAVVIQLGPDPLFSRTPVRDFPAALTLAGETAPALTALIDAMAAHAPDPAVVEPRRERIVALAAANRVRTIEAAERGCAAPMSKEWVSLCLGRAIREHTDKGRRASVFHELGCPLLPLDLEHHNSYFQEPHSGGLGWGLPAAMGVPLDLQVIKLVLNNEEWGAVRNAAEGLYRGGLAPQANDVPLTGLRPSPDFTLTAQASRAYTETVTDGTELPAALERAIAVATGEKRQVLLNIAVARTSPV